MYSMTAASFGWGTWWVVLFLRRFLPHLDPGLFWPTVLSMSFGLIGFAAALVTVRARRSWLLFALVPLGANLSLLFVPWLRNELIEAAAG